MAIFGSQKKCPLRNKNTKYFVSTYIDRKMYQIEILGEQQIVCVTHQEQSQRYGLKIYTMRLMTSFH